MKVVGVGLNKTGTKTLGAVLRHWHLKHQSFSPEAFELWRAGDIAGLLGWVGDYDSFEDWPWPLIYREIDDAFPSVKFILTTRASPAVWFESLCRHANRTGPTMYRELVYGHAMPHAHRAEHLMFYKRHNREVRAYFRDRPGDLLEVCWENGNGWPEVAGFLGFEAPDIPFPHENKAAP